MNIPNTFYWYALRTVRGVGPGAFLKLLDLVGDPERIWKSSYQELVTKGVSEHLAQAIGMSKIALDPEECMASFSQQNIGLLPFNDMAYPSMLRQIALPPPLLFYRGSVEVLTIPTAVAIVGTRNNTSYGAKVTNYIVPAMVHAGLVIVSGLANGIDTIAHQTALAVGGSCIGVLGNGLQYVVPASNRGLYDAIVKKGGILLSEYPPDQEPVAGLFPARNRIISGICQATVVIEAGEKSGALITANHAAEQGRDVFAIPGDIFSPVSFGTNKLLLEGAKPATGAEVILESYGISNTHSEHISEKNTQDLTADQLEVWKTLSKSPRHIDVIVRESTFSTSKILQILAELILKDFALEGEGSCYTRR